MSKAVLKRSFRLVFLLTCVTVVGFYLFHQQWAQVQNQKINRENIRVVFGVLHAPIHPLGRVSLAEPDTAAILLLEASFAADRKNVNHRSIRPEEIAKSRALIRLPL